MRMLRLSFLLPLLWLVMPSQAQTARVVASCGTPSQTYPVGVDRPITVDTSGRLCGLDTATQLPAGGTLEAAATAAITDTTSTAIFAAGVGSLKHYPLACKVTNSHATVGTFVKILDGATIIDEGYAAPAGGGWTTSYGTPLPTTAATALNCQAVTTGANFICSCNGYKAN